MGSWNASCAISHLPIRYGDPVRLVMLTETPRKARFTGGPAGLTYSTDLWCPASFAVRATYDDYGRACPLDPCDWRVELYLSALRTALAPVAAATNPGREMPCLPEALTDMVAVQKLCQKAGGRVRVGARHDTASAAGFLMVGFLMVHERVYQEMTRGHTDLFDEVVTPARIVAEAPALLEALTRLGNTPFRSDLDDLPQVSGLSAFLFDHTGGGVHRHGVTLSLDSAARAFRASLTDPSLGPAHPRVRALLQEIAEFMVFHETLAMLNRHYAPTLNAGQDEEPEIHHRISRAVMDLLDARDDEAAA